MKWLLNIWLLLFIQPVFSQEDPAALANRLTSSCKTDLEKVTSIFKWIAENISYNTTPRYKRAIIGELTAKYAREELTEDTGALKPLNERVAETVLRRKTAFCEGYARLFTTLCDYAGIQSVLVPGYGKTNLSKPGPRFGVNHYWNAVLIDSAWHLLDVTWASGYVSWQNDEFIQQYDAHYFLTPPEEFIRDHYPDDLQWTLLVNSPTPKEFVNAPFRQKSFYKYKITAYYPSTGVIEAAVGDTIQVELEGANVQNDRQIIPDLLIDSTFFSRSPSWVFLKSVETDSLSSNPNRLNYTYTIASPDVEWLFILYNGDPVLRYRVHVRRNRL
jgi:transglutaminase/protease-like cytokinesis protein 3